MNVALTPYSPLFSNSRNVSKRLRLMRHTGSHDKRYRLVISATERQTNNRSRQQSKQALPATASLELWR